jgi:hypothetical protein
MTGSPDVRSRWTSRSYGSRWRMRLTNTAISSIPTAPRPVAGLSPLPAGSSYRQMLAGGKIARANREAGELPEPLHLSSGQESASAVLARLRSDER